MILSISSRAPLGRHFLVFRLRPPPSSAHPSFRSCSSRIARFGRKPLVLSFTREESRAIGRLLSRSEVLSARTATALFHTSSATPANRSDGKESDGDGGEGDDEWEREKERRLAASKIFAAFTIGFSLFYLFFADDRSEEARRTLRQGPARYEGPISWKEFYNKMLMAGEVESIEVVALKEGSMARVYLHPDAIYNGTRLRRSFFSLDMGRDTRETIEDKIRRAEAKLGIPAGDGVAINYRRPNFEIGVIVTFIIGIAVVAFAARQINKAVKASGGFNPFQGMSKAHFTLIDPKKKNGLENVKFADVAGLYQAKVEVKEFVDYLKQPDKYKELGARPPRGAILFGPPGCGKTMLAKAVANESGVPFLSMNGSEFTEMIGGLGAARVRDLFGEARKRKPSIIYIDEIDAIGKKRGGPGAMGGGNQEGEQTLNQLLVEMDGMGSTEEVIMLASTNRSDVLDKALLRPGRLDRHIEIDLPNLIERKEILEHHMKGVVLDDKSDVFSERLATLTPGFSGADLANVINEAALHAARHKQTKVSRKNLEYAIERVVAGAEKKTGALGPKEKRIVAYHESGHALVGWMLRHTDALLKVTILPRTGATLGFAQYTPSSDKKLYSPEELMDRMCMALGGRVAESLTFNSITTGAQNDLQKVTNMAYAQIKQFGFNDVVGLVSFEQGQGGQGGKRPFSKRLAATMDHEARKLIAEAYQKTERVLNEHQAQLAIMAEELLKRETLNYDDVEKLLGPPPHGKKHLVSPADYERQLREQGDLGNSESGGGVAERGGGGAEGAGKDRENAS